MPRLPVAVMFTSRADRLLGGLLRGSDWLWTSAVVESPHCLSLSAFFVMGPVFDALCNATTTAAERRDKTSV